MIDDNDFIYLIIYLLILNSYYTDIAIILLLILRTDAPTVNLTLLLLFYFY